MVSNIGTFSAEKVIVEAFDFDLLAIGVTPHTAVGACNHLRAVIVVDTAGAVNHVLSEMTWAVVSE